MALRARRSVGFGKFQSLVSIIVLILQVAVVGLADAKDKSFQSSPIVQWGCDIYQKTTEIASKSRSSSSNNNKNANRNIKNSPPWGLCDQIRGGRLGKDENEKLELSSSVTVTAEAVTEDANSNDEATIPTDDGVTKVLEKPNTERSDYSSSPYSFPLFQENDGSQTDPDGIPNRYMKMQYNDREKAKKCLEATIKWREENDIDTILARPHPEFDVCKRVFPNYFCGRDDTGHVILLQRPGLIDLKVAELNGLTGEDLLYHYVYEMEYLWQIIEPRADETMTSIIDLTGLNFSVLTKRELIHVVQLFCKTMDAHFPQRSHKTLLINAPNWFGAIYKLISPLLRESTKQKIAILSKGKKQDEELRSVLAECPIDEDQPLDQIPPSQMEKDLREFVLARLEESGVDMRVVIE